MRISEQLFPRVCALICTSNDEKDNVMTASFLMPISFNPKYVCFSISPFRYSFENLKKNPQFTMNILTEDMLKISEICGRYSGKNTDKFKLAGLKKEESKFIKPPMIKNCPVSFECKVEYMEKFGDHFLVIGKVVNEIIRDYEFKPLLHKTKKEYFKITNLN